MRFHFTSGSFYTRKIKKYLLIFLVYVFVTTYPFFSFFPHDLIPEINLKELIFRINNFFYTPVAACIGTQVFTLAFIADLISDVFSFFSSFDDDDKVNDETNHANVLRKHLRNNFDLLDLFNPFLYKDKTRELLE